MRFTVHVTGALTVFASLLVGCAGVRADTCCDVMPMLPLPTATVPGGEAPMIIPISPLSAPQSMPPVIASPAPASVVVPAGLPAFLRLSVPGTPPMAAVGTGAAMPVARGVYTVQKGVRLVVVAQRTGTRFADLILLNPDLALDRKLPAGTRVKLPIAGTW